MKNSLNYTGLSNMFVVSRKRKKTPQNGLLVIEAGQTSADDPFRFCPPYLMQQSSTKGNFKK